MPYVGLWVRAWYLTHTGTTIQVGAVGVPAIEWTDGSAQALPGSARIATLIKINFYFSILGVKTNNVLYGILSTGCLKVVSAPARRNRGLEWYQSIEH